MDTIPVLAVLYMYTVVEILGNSIPNKIRNYKELIKNVKKAQLGGLSPPTIELGGFSSSSPPCFAAYGLGGRFLLKRASVCSD